MNEPFISTRTKRWDDGAPVFLEGESGPDERRGFVLDTSVCANPECDCGQVFLRLLPATLAPNSRLPTPRGQAVNLSFDVKSGAIQPLRADGSHEDLIAWVKDHLGSEGSDWLSSRYTRLRGQLGTPEAAPIDINRFQPGTLIPFDQVFPNAWDLMVERDGKRYVLLDQYCLNPTCACEEAAFELFDHQGEVAIGLARFDFKSFKLVEVKGPATLDLVWAKFLDEGGAKSLHSRRETARDAGRKLFGALKQVKVGRNEPCPCGSGKKHKKCCGALG